MNRQKILLSVLCVMALAAAIAVLSVTGASGGANKPTTMSEDVSGISSDIDAVVSSDSDVKYSSNPFDYAKDSPALTRLVEKGTPALPVISARIESSGNNGLQEYLLMIAALRISKVDIANGPEDSPLRSVQEAKQWPKAWDAYVRSVPRRVGDIHAANLPLSEKNRLLTALGTPALPTLLDKIGRGSSEYAPAADQLLQGCVEVNGALDIHVTPAWARANAAKFEALRAMTQGSK